MTLSVWRYAHLTLAVFSSLFLIIASFTGIILAIDAVNEKIPPYRVDNFNSITLGETLVTLNNVYPEISEIAVDHNGFVLIQGIDNQGNDINAFINPTNGKIFGPKEKKSEWMQWVTSLHRSLFLHETGRIVIGILSFLLLLITISGTILVIQRQKTFRRFFGKITKESFTQHYHVVLGRFMLIPIIIIAFTGTVLFMERLDFFGEEKISHKIQDPDLGVYKKKAAIDELRAFKNIKLIDVKNVEFPFIDEPGEYYIVKLTDREIVVNQFTGIVVSEVFYSNTARFAVISLLLHTGRIGMIWAVVLAIAALSILFFIYSGFAIMMSRRSVRIKNKFNPDQGQIILLVGSENGSTLRFATAIHKQLLAGGHMPYLAQLNDYSLYPKAQHIIVFTSTHGLGDPPSNAVQFETLVSGSPQKQSIKISVVGFGSSAYPDFCGFAKKVKSCLLKRSWAEDILPLYFINDKSVGEFLDWVKAWSLLTGIPLSQIPASYNQKPKKLLSLKVINKISGSDRTFILTLKPPAYSKFTSGDLLALYPASDNRERLYSIARIKNNIQLVVKLHENGLGSGYLNNLEIGDVFKARILNNSSFHMPKQKDIILISNGTGIAPFLGMFTTKRQRKIQLYCGFRQETFITQHFRKTLVDNKDEKECSGIHIAFSREADKLYVMDLVQRDAANFVLHLEKGSIIMLCGSIQMQLDVEKTLDRILIEKNKKDLQYYKSKGQILADCY